MCGTRTAMCARSRRLPVCMSTMRPGIGIPGLFRISGKGIPILPVVEAETGLFLPTQRQL